MFGVGGKIDGSTWWFVVVCHVEGTCLEFFRIGIFVGGWHWCCGGQNGWFLLMLVWRWTKDTVKRRILGFLEQRRQRRSAAAHGERAFERRFHCG